MTADLRERALEGMRFNLPVEIDAERILALLAVIEAADALRNSRRASPRTKQEMAYDAARAELEQFTASRLEQQSGS